MWGVVVMMGCLVGGVSTNYPIFDINTQMRLLLLPADARIGSVIYRLRATDSDRDYPLVFAATDYGSYVIRIDNLPCNKNSSYCEANVFLERSLAPDQLFKFRITVKDSTGDTTTIPVTIKITNGVTDFNEVFPHVPGVVMIPEDTKVGTELEYVIVKKNPRYIRQANLEMWGSSNFKFQQSAKKDTTTGRIILASSLDYETKTMYKLSVFATGMWVDPATDSRNIAGFQLVVVVTDVQDTPPVFDPIEPITPLNPNLTIGDVVMRITARDGDKGAPRPVNYGLVSEGNPFTVFFSIDRENGDIRLVRPLKELKIVSRSHQPILLTVIAEEIVAANTKEKDNLISTTATVALLLGQLDNTPPFFESDRYVTHIRENSPQGTALVFSEVYITEVRDNDMGKYGVFSLTLGNNNGTFEISPNVGERQATFIIRVRDNTLLDYEQRREVSFKIWAKELNPEEKPLSASADVTVYITDENDNPPVFLQKNYSAYVPENATAGYRLMKFEATDVDTSDAGAVKYTRVFGTRNTSLSLDPDSGILYIANDNHGIDREESSSYQFFIEARDMKGSGNKAVVPFTLFVMDVNDNPPIFEKNPYDFILGSDGKNFSQKAYIKAIDADAEAPNNIVRYEIVRGNYGNRFILDSETGELQVNPNSLMRYSRQIKNAVTDLLARAYDSGVPTLWTTVQLRIFPSESSARVMRFLVSGRNPERRSVEQLLTDLTGARVVIHSIEPFIPGQTYFARTTDLTGGSTNADKSIVTATILYNNGAIVDLDKIQKHLANNQTVKVISADIDDTVKVYRSETRALFWVLIILILLIALVILMLLLCCFCECCPFYAFFSRLVRKKSAVQAVNTVTYQENAEGKENKSVQAERISRGREAWSADHAKLNWSFNRRNSARRLVLLPNERQRAPNIIFTKAVGSLERIPRDDLILEDVDGTEYRLLDPSRLSFKRQPLDTVSMRRSDRTREIDKDNNMDETALNEGMIARPPSRDERFIRDGNAEILRLVTRGRADHYETNEEPTLNKPQRPFTMVEDADEKDGKEDIMRRFIDESNSIKDNDDHGAPTNEDLFVRVMNMDEKEVTTADVNRLTMIQRDLLLTRFLVEERRRITNASLIEDTQSLPGVMTMATQTDSHAGTQTDKSFLRKRKTKSDNDDSMSDSEENVRRRFKRGVKMRMQEERVVDAFQNKSKSRCEIKTPIIEETEISVENANKPEGHVAPTKASLLRHAVARTKVVEDDDVIPNDSPNQVLTKTKSMSEQDLCSLTTRRENIVRSLQITPIKQLNITNNVLVEHVHHNDDQSLSRLSVQQVQNEQFLSVPLEASTQTPKKLKLSRMQYNSEPRKKSISRVSSPQRPRASSLNRPSSVERGVQNIVIPEKGTTPRYMEWYKKKRERLEQERRGNKESLKLEQKTNLKQKMPVRKKTLEALKTEKVVSNIEESKKKSSKLEATENSSQIFPKNKHESPKKDAKNMESTEDLAEGVTSSSINLVENSKIDEIESISAINESQNHGTILSGENEKNDNDDIVRGSLGTPGNVMIDTDYDKEKLREEQKSDGDLDSGIAMQYTIGSELPLRNQKALEKKSIFTIAYDNMETKKIRMDTASPP